MPTNDRIGDILVAQGHLSREAAEEIASQRLRSDTRYASIVLRTGRISDVQALQALATKSGFPYQDLTNIVIPKSILELVPFEISRQQLLLPLAIEDGHLLLAMANPHEHRIIEEIGFATGLPIKPHIALHAQLATSIIEAHCSSGQYYFGPGVSEKNRQVVI